MDAFDTDAIAALLQASARDGEPMTYADVLLARRIVFSRPKMRALCRVLDEIDRRAAAAGQPELAVLVVRQSDGLPGQGWWVGRQDWRGAWEGPAARTFVAQVQRRAFDYWRAR